MSKLKRVGRAALWALAAGIMIVVIRPMASQMVASALHERYVPPAERNTSGIYFSDGWTQQDAQRLQEYERRTHGVGY